MASSLFFQILQVMIPPQLAIDLCTLIPKGKVILQADTVPCITIQRVMTIPRVVFGFYPLILLVNLMLQMVMNLYLVTLLAVAILGLVLMPYVQTKPAPLL